MYAVEMRKITKRFGSFTANDQIDFLVKKGEIHCLLGENGAGKSNIDECAVRFVQSRRRRIKDKR